VKVCKEEAVKNTEKTGAVAMVVVLLAVGGAMSQVLGPDAMMKGVEFTRASSLITYNSSEAHQSLELLRATGANWVTIVPIWWMADTGRSAICFRPDSSPSDAELEVVINQARSLGMAVFLKPEIRCSTGVWIGRHKPHSSSWYNYYRVFIMHYAQLAQETHCQMFSVGSELDSTTTADTAWAQIINWVKGAYLGPVTYSADWRTYQEIPFWDSLDVIGINAYFPVCYPVTPYEPNVMNLSEHWKDTWVPEIEGFRDSLGLTDSTKPVIFTEIGYRSITCCAAEPWNDTVSGTYDSTEQRNCYIAALHSLLGKPWFAGWFWHEWTTDPNQGGVGDLSYSPKGKKAQEVLRRWFASIGSQKGADLPAYGPVYGFPHTQLALESLAHSHANWVAISSNWHMDSCGANYGTIAPDDTSDAAAETAIRWAHEAGLNVCLRAYLACSSQEWQNNHEPNGNVQWFRDESVHVRYCAEMAEQAGCEMLTVGMELNNTTDSPGEPDLWRDMVIAGAREAYSGPLTYGAHWFFLDPTTGDSVSAQFWDALDFAGIDAYFQLFPWNQYVPYGDARDTWSYQTPSVSDLTGENQFPPDTLAWGGRGNPGKWIPLLESLYGVIQKPIVFTEIGYRSMDSAAWQPSHDQNSNWVVQNSDTSYDLYSVCFPVDTMTGYAVGDYGTILKTTNSGDTWIPRTSGTSVRLYAVDFPVVDTGYAVGQAATVLKTTDGWSSYAEKPAPEMNLPYYSVCFPENPNEGIVVGGAGVILRTTNGGNSWTRLYCVGDSFDTVRVALRSVSLVPNDTQLVGYIVGDDGTLLKSTDAGLTWHVKSTPVTVRLNSISLVSPDTCFVACDSNHLIWTTDGGETWIDSTFRDQAGWDYKAVCVPDYGSARFLVGSAGTVIRAGSSWPFDGSYQTGSQGQTLRGVQFRTIHQAAADDRYVGFAVGDAGTILKASNGGRMIVDFNEQANCYEAAFKSFWGDWHHPSPLPWFYGFHWWKWTTDESPMTIEHEVRIDDYTPQQKPAGDLLRQWYDWTVLQPHDTFAWLARHYPTGSLDLIVPASGKVNVPPVLAKLESHNWEEGGSADSARLLQEYYGLGDTVIYTDSTAWFPFVGDTTWLFLHGQGKYRFYAQYLDYPNKLSPPYPDFEDTVIVFDTTGPTGSVVTNHGSRFTSSATCTLSLAAQDSSSGVAEMRFMNVPKVNLVTNGSFTATAGSWSYAGSGSGYDTTLGMAKLATGASTCVRQFIPAESISAYSGDSCVLQASVMALMHGGNALGDISYWHYYVRTDTSLHDTSWTLVDSATFQDSLAFWGQSPGAGNTLTRRFLLTTPAAESGWVWRGGMVRVQAVGVNGAVGTVWADNITLNGFQSDTGYAWWRAYDTLAAWNIGSGAGQHIVRALYLDSAGNENATPAADTIILDPTAPVVHITLPSLGQMVNGTVEITGWAYDPVEVSGDTWFSARRLYYRHVDSTNWRPVLPDSCSHVPAYPDSQQILGPAVDLGYWNTLSVQNGQYYLKLVADDSAGNLSSCSTWVMVFHGGGGGNFCAGPPGGGTGMGEGSCYVGSATGNVLHVSDDLIPLDSFQVSDSGSQARITAVLEVGSDSLLVLDAQNRRIHKLHRNGQNRRRLVSNLSQPAGLTRDANGNFWLVDKGWHRIGKFRSNGTLVFVRGGLGADSLHFHSPEGIAVKGSLVYAADTKNDRVAVWDTSGNFKTTITGDFENPTAVLPTDSGTIYLTDGSDGRLKGITPLGGNIVAIGTTDSSKLRGLVPSENRHNLFSLATEPNKVYKLRIQSDDSIPGGQQSAGKVSLPKALSLAQPFPNPARTRLNIAYALPHQTRVVLKLYDVAGKVVTTLANGNQKPGYHCLTWNRQDTKGRTCACGVYFCTLSAENQRFSRKVVLTE
jgi:photosystem II stability/assembly factor-like uncharacterized protein